MSRCVSITKKGDRCRNKALAGFDRCHIHAEKQSYAVRRVSGLKTKSLCGGKLCDGNKICNPATGRCVSLTGNIGRKLIQGNEVNPKPNKILNPYLSEQVDPDEEDNCGPDRLTLARIPRKYPVIRNILRRYCDVLPLKDIKYIVGPNQYTEFRYKNYKIGIFGEYHGIRDFPLSSKTDTLTFSAFLTSLVTQTKRQYDFFAELSYKRRDVADRELLDRNMMVDVIEHEFKDCLRVEKVTCPYKNLRAHYIDNRNLYPEYRRSLAFSIYWYYAYDYENPNVKSPPRGIINEFLKTAQEEYDYQTRFVERVLQDKTSKIEKQLQHNELRDKITSFIQKQMQDNKRKFMTDLKQYSKTIDKDFTREPLTEEDIKVVRLLADHFIYIFTNIMDIYLLGRIFRTYPNDSGGSPENIIIYAGGYHTELYTSFLYYIGANKTIDILNRQSLYYLEFSDQLKVDSFLFNP
jgi:hypothetical protein